MLKANCSNDKLLESSAVIIQRFWRVYKQKAIILANLKKIVKRIHHRNNVAREIASTELSYLNSLNTIITTFLQPMEKAGISKGSIEIIFSNIAQIHQLHSNLHEDFKQRMEHWGNHQVMADILGKLIPFLKLYRDYCARYHAAIAKLEEKMKRPNSKISVFLRAESGAFYELPALLIMPIQRIPRYKLLVSELLKLTPQGHADYVPLSKALKNIEEVADFINESVRERENMDKLSQLQSKFHGKTQLPDLAHPYRKLVLEGQLMKVCRKTSKKRWFFLFSDLLYATVKLDDGEYKVHRVLELSKCKAIDVPDNEIRKHAFQILSNKKSFVVYAASEAEKANWMKELLAAISTSGDFGKKILKKFTSTANIQHLKEPMSDEEAAPVWVPDKDAKKCMLCQTSFTTIKRRHHCRRCGSVVCGACSENKHKLENLGKVARVCSKCFDELQGSVGNPEIDQISLALRKPPRNTGTNSPPVSPRGTSSSQPGSPPRRAPLLSTNSALGATVSSPALLRKLRSIPQDNSCTSPREQYVNEEDFDSDEDEDDQDSKVDSPTEITPEEESASRQGRQLPPPPPPLKSAAAKLPKLALSSKGASRGGQVIQSRPTQPKTLAAQTSTSPTHSSMVSLQPNNSPQPRNLAVSLPPNGPPPVPPKKVNLQHKSPFRPRPTPPSPKETPNPLSSSTPSTTGWSNLRGNTTTPNSKSPTRLRLGISRQHSKSSDPISKSAISKS